MTPQEMSSYAKGRGGHGGVKRALAMVGEAFEAELEAAYSRGMVHGIRQGYLGGG